MPKRISHQDAHRRQQTFIKNWRKHRGVSQQALADELDTSKSSVSRIESGKQPYTQDFLEVTARKLKTTPANLISRDPNEENR